ncbi:MAG: biopolymer transporter ExbD [Pelomonas sp.]|nr:biopolymer transporter ExbD [Roseateles sp.]
MGMNVGNASSDSGDAEPMMDVNTTPLIDVMLVLLVMLIITIPIQLHTINLDMPPPSHNQPPTPPVVHEVFIDFDGSLSWDGTSITTAQLEDKFQGVANEPDQPEVHIKPNKLVDYGAVAHVMASAQRHGVKKMGMVGNEQFAQ